MFSARWDADQRAIARWQAATGRERTWPDHADMVVWLLGEVDRLTRERDEALLAAGKVRLCVNCGRLEDATTTRRSDDLPECRDADGLSACTFDATPQEAVEIWARRWHETCARAAATEAERDALKAEVADLKLDVIAFCGPWAANYARGLGLPDGHLHPTHYDMLARCGARMDDFVRAALARLKETTDAQ